MNLIYNKEDIRVLELSFIDEDDFLKAELQLPNFPFELQDKISKYSQRLDRCLRIGGKWMLQQLIKDFDLSHQLGLDQLQYSSENKSFFTSQLFFSIAHAGNRVVTAASIHQRLGIDMEEIKAIQLTDYIAYLTHEELLFLQKSLRPVNDFYTLWTKKEALAKLMGMGIEFNYKETSVINNTTKIGSMAIQFEEISTQPNYKIMLAHDILNHNAND